MLFGEAAVRAWEGLAPLIEQRRREPGHARTALYFQLLCESAQTWMDSSEFREELQVAQPVQQASNALP
jgi:hypothetical protein